MQSQPISPPVSESVESQGNRCQRQCEHCRCASQPAAASTVAAKLSAKGLDRWADPKSWPVISLLIY